MVLHDAGICLPYVAANILQCIRQPSRRRHDAHTFVLLQSLLPVPYFASERSFAQFRLPEDTKAVVGFGTTSNSLVVVSASGSFYTASFDHDKGGACKQDSFCKFVELDA